MSDGELTPLMRQYRNIKRGYPDAILFFRVGDFYEMFYEDAEEASRILSIALTSRDKQSADPVPLCGVPYHAATGYLAKLLKAGRTVALCEQVEDPKLAKGLVRREVVRLYTPGTLVDTELLPRTDANFLAAIHVESDRRMSRRASSSIGLAALEVSTGDFWIAEFRGDQAVADLLDELTRLDPREVLYPNDGASEHRSWLGEIRGARLSAQPRLWFDLHQATQLLLEQFRLGSLDGLGCQGMTAGVRAGGAVFRYLRETQPSASLDHIRSLTVRRIGDAMHLDSATIHNLELLRPMTTVQRLDTQNDATLLTVLDRTVTAMGARLMREWILRPLVTVQEIHARLDAVSELKSRLEVRVHLRAALRNVQDLSRLSSRVSLGVATPRDLLALKQSVAALPELQGHLALCGSSLLKNLAASWDNATDLHESIDRAVDPEAPLSSREGGIFLEGYHAGVDELRKASKEGKGWIAALEATERQRTGIDSLKVRFNQVFGYYIEVTKTNLPRIPADYIRKQTLANAERFMTPDLKELEERVTGAEAKLMALEQELFESLRTRVARDTPRLQAIGHALALLDVLAGLAETAALNQYVRPTVDEGDAIHIVEGRHPVVERLDLVGGFIPNDLLLDRSENRLLILTGPNMAGKSTYLRQVALIVLMAQIGSFVPAREARIGLVDRIFTRVGASDNLAAGQSTFMVEMTETANILNSATARSLILLDEIGRGTSTYDGLSIAWAVAEHIQDTERLGARSLFATHYHEMTQLESTHPGVKNCRVAVQERDGDVLFLRKIVAGGADKSYGIHVAKLAGLPSEVLHRAKEVLAQLERPTATVDDAPGHRGAAESDRSLPAPHPIIEEVRQMDLFSMTPLDALNRLAELQRKLGSE